MSTKLELSRKSQRFLDDLRTYLFTSRKSLSDVDEIISDLENHLYEAEQNGKSIEKVVGRSPKEYMKMISDEMVTDNKNWFKYICLIVFGLFSFIIMPDILNLNLSFTVLEIGSHIAISTIFILSAFAYFKYNAITENPLAKRVFIQFGMVLLLSAISFSLIYLNKYIESPVIYFGPMGSLLVAVIMGFFLIGLVIWASK